jgi:DNA recombination protein RmuC
MTIEFIALISISTVLLVVLFAIFFKQTSLRDAFIRLDTRQQSLNEHLEKLATQLDQRIRANEGEMSERQLSFEKHQFESLKLLQDSLQKGIQEVRQQITQTLDKHTDSLTKRVDTLTQETNQRLQEISAQVERRLSEGFEKTTTTFNNVIERLALIDEAQKKITDLSTNVVSLQEILSDKRSRGAFGEVQLAHLVRNLMPENAFSLQHTFKNGCRADCVLFLPEPTGVVAIDAKFPLENYRRMVDISSGDADRQAAKQQFRKDIKKHIQDIASKYIIPSETSDGAMMFIPAEAIFAEIHSHYPDLVEEAHKSRVWMASPTTMMAILTTSRAVLKDAATRQQVHLIQEHLGYLSKDFQRFQERMQALATHINQAHKDVEDVGISAKKITSRFGKIEKVELGPMETTDVGALLAVSEAEDA